MRFYRKKKPHFTNKGKKKRDLVPLFTFKEQKKKIPFTIFKKARDLLKTHRKVKHHNKVYLVPKPTSKILKKNLPILPKPTSKILKKPLKLDTRKKKKKKEKKEEQT